MKIKNLIIAIIKAITLITILLIYAISLLLTSGTVTLILVFIGLVIVLSITYYEEFD